MQDLDMVNHNQVNKKFKFKEELTHIMNNKQYEFPLNLAMVACWLIIHYKGENIKVLEMRELSALTEFSILADIKNGPQADAIVDALAFNLKQLGYPVKGIEGKYDSQWRLIDFGDIMVHLFTDEARQIYNIERLWSQATIREIPETFYFQEKNADLEKRRKNEDTENDENNEMEDQDPLDNQNEKKWEGYF